ncbi:polysaccharide deacetylase [Flavobacterium rivuli WB 3.3-2 = DSM 21788]|uniref:Polysaccharide deacetylase n=1 Tax=Flavobacterium rivuli WB 3.3-2 = DSM 21788 TaxID=1121895 RepID=A0A0A2M4B7_9FLAO|nr:polysaccharide deacetylase family protein [Flavobacterium rivuli]KGO86461.1 polysaccharide deacetylase [Flavobacterium rivuli WB 3.3-2 = DSM 21788]
MKLYWVKTHKLIKKLFRGFVWDIPGRIKTVYLTFDDGPIPEATPWVLDVLREHNIKATFFCIGDNIQKHPDTFRQVIADGHTIGNHTFNHFNGWNTDNETYVANFEKCEKAIEERYSGTAKLFRPPYGKIKNAQAKVVRLRGYRIIMWDVLSADFDQSITPEQCLQNVTNNVSNGSVIIFHDSIKASANLRYALPEAIKYLKKNNYEFGVIT